MRKIRVWILKYILFIGLIFENITTLDELLTNVVKLEEKEKKIYEFSITAGNYIHHLNRLKAWKSKNTKDIIQKIKNKTLLMVKEDGKNVLPTRKM